LTIERNSSGDGQYALLRGMDKLPSELLDRLEITKSLDATLLSMVVASSISMCL
jgi:hypothetical protein